MVNSRVLKRESKHPKMITEQANLQVFGSVFVYHKIVIRLRGLPIYVSFQLRRPRNEPNAECDQRSTEKRLRHGEEQPFRRFRDIGSKELRSLFVERMIRRDLS